MRCAIVYKAPELKERVGNFLNELGVITEFFAKPSRDLESFDFIVTIGGDGTILSVLQEIRDCPPIFGINTGKVGILTHAKPEEFEVHLKEAVEKFEVEEFTRLECECDGGEFLALNEVAFLTRERGKLMRVTIRIDGEEVDSLRCDGVVASTQIGSTAYAFSLGGPVVDPYLECILIVPIAPFRFGWKPIVIRSDRVVDFESESSIAVIDGKRFVETNEVFVRKSDFPAVFFAKKKRFMRTFHTIRRIE